MALCKLETSLETALAHVAQVRNLSVATAPLNSLT